MATVAEKGVIEYLEVARGLEGSLIQALSAHIAVTPRGGYRTALERHLSETRGHQRRIDQRLDELGRGRGLLTAGLGLAQAMFSQVLASTTAPLGMLLAQHGEERLLANARDELASEAVEIATYTALRELAVQANDQRTVQLAESILADEERMTAAVREEIPALTRGVLAARDGNSTYKVTETGAADAARNVVSGAAGVARETVAGAAGVARETATGAADLAETAADATVVGVDSARSAAREGAEKTERTARRAARTTVRQARKVPGVAAAEGEVKGAIAEEGDLAIHGYDGLTAAQIDEQLPRLSQIELAKIDGYERRNKNRSTVLGKIESLQSDEPWPGYDELTVEEIRSATDDLDDEDRARRIREYERSHKNRSGVLDALDRTLAAH